MVIFTDLEGEGSEVEKETGEVSALEGNTRYQGCNNFDPVNKLVNTACPQMSQDPLQGLQYRSGRLQVVWCLNAFLGRVVLFLSLIALPYNWPLKRCKHEQKR